LWLTSTDLTCMSMKMTSIVKMSYIYRYIDIVGSIGLTSHV